MRRLAAASLAVLVVACGAPLVPGTTFRATFGVTAAPSVVATGAASAGARPAFLAYAFTDVRDGSKFTLSDFAGKSVLVIGMAVW